MKKLAFTLVAAALSVTASSQNIKDYIKSAPASVFQCIDSLSRADMFEKGAVSVFGDSVTMHKTTDNFMSFSVSNLDVQVRIADETIIVCRTYAGQNSEVSFYDSDWQIKSSWIYGNKCSKKMPSDKKIFEALVAKPDDMSEERFESLKLYFDPLLVRAELSDTEDAMTLVPVAPMLTEEEKEDVKTVIKQKTFKWINGKFK